jgi:hypothetical protein
MVGVQELICEAVAWDYRHRHHRHHNQYRKEMAHSDCQLFNPFLVVQEETLWAIAHQEVIK